ncbi:hypothetical protein [Paenibacillus plantiphilus]|nr:hypothetical protein [Paenibacillus plantiphilus]
MKSMPTPNGNTIAIEDRLRVAAITTNGRWHGRHSFGRIHSASIALMQAG